MRRIFIDTSAWCAIANSGDINHGAALAFRDEIAGHCRLLASNYILDELYTPLLMDVGYRETVNFKLKIDILIQRKALEVVWVLEDTAAKAWKIFEQFNTDKQWSYTDCVSYEIMKRLGISEAFSFDHHFAQMGFIKLPVITA